MNFRVAGDRLLVEKQYIEVGTIKKEQKFSNIIKVLGVGDTVLRKFKDGQGDEYKIGDMLLVSGTSDFGEEVYVQPSQVLRWVTEEEFLKFPNL